MIRKIQHLRGTPEQYRDHDPIIPDGELALVRRKDGTFDVKIGNGAQPFCALPFVGRTVEQSESGSILLRHSFEHRLGEVERVEILLPDEIPEDFHSVLVFGSGLGGCTLSYPAERVVFTGDHTKGGVFYPEKRSHYAVSFYQRENLIGYVSAVSYENEADLPQEIVTTAGIGSVGYVGKSEDMLEITVDGQLEEVDPYGYYYGVGMEEEEGYSLSLLLANENVMTYDDLCTRMKQSYTSNFNVKFTQEENAFCYFSKVTYSNGFITRFDYPFLENTTYHLHFTIAKRDCEPLAVGEFFESGIRVIYTDETSTLIRAPYTGGTDAEGNPMQTLDFYSDPLRKIQDVALAHTPEGATNVLFPEGFLFAAEVAGSGELPAPNTREISIAIPSLMVNLGEIHDTLSLGSGLFTKRVYAEPATNLTCSVADTSKMFTVFRLKLLKPAKPLSPVFISGFSNRKLDEIGKFQNSCCIDESGEYLYFTMTATEKTLQNYQNTTYSNVLIPFYLLPEEEITELEIPEFSLSDGFNAIAVKYSSIAKITLTHYN